MSGTDGNNERKPKRRLFADVSTVQVVATAAAAVTSMLLSSYIGIAGSVIGVAVASVVSTLAASLYKKFLADSAEKLKELPVVAHPNGALAHVLPGHRGGEASSEEDAEGGRRASEGSEAAGADGEALAMADGDGERAVGAQASEALTATGSAQVTEALEASSDGQGSAAGEDATGLDGEAGPADASNVRSAAASANLDPVAALHRQRRLVRGLIVVCIVSALLAVAASGAVVYFATMGAGLGQKPAPIYLSAPFTPVDDGADGSSSSQATSAASSSGNNATASGSSSNIGDGGSSEGSSGEDGGDAGNSDGSGSSGNETDPANPGGDTETGNTTPGGTSGETPDPDNQPNG